MLMIGDFMYTILYYCVRLVKGEERGRPLALEGMKREGENPFWWDDRPLVIMFASPDVRV